MIAAAAASSRSFRLPQSRSRIASRLSASLLDRRSSSVRTGSVVRRFSASTNATTRAVAGDGVPSSRDGRPTTISARPSSSRWSRSTISATRSIAADAPVTVTVSSGRASAPDGSLIANPIRRSPTSMPRTRIPQWYNFALLDIVKRLVVALLVVCLGAATACGTRRPAEKFRQKLVILGFDGMDPRLVQRWMNEGKLPNMKKLAAAGSGVRPLGTTHSPESPTAWASFATGVNAGKHNIYDFLIRDTRSYLP